MPIKLMFMSIFDIGFFGLFYGLVISGVLGKLQPQNQTSVPLRRFANLSAIAFGVTLCAFAILGDAWKNNWFDYQTHVNLFRATSYTFLVIFLAIFVIGLLRLSWADKLLIAAAFGGALLMEVLFYPVPYWIKGAFMLLVISLRGGWLIFSLRRAALK